MHTPSITCHHCGKPCNSVGEYVRKGGVQMYVHLHPDCRDAYLHGDSKTE